MAAQHVVMQQQHRQHVLPLAVRAFFSSSSSSSSAEDTPTGTPEQQQQQQQGDAADVSKHKRNRDKQAAAAAFAKLPGSLIRQPVFGNNLSSTIKSRKPAIRFPARHQWRNCAEDYDPMESFEARPLPPYAPLRAHTKDYNKIFHETKPQFHRNRCVHACFGYCWCVQGNCPSRVGSLCSPCRGDEGLSVSLCL